MSLSERGVRSARALATLWALPHGQRLPFALCWWALLSSRLRLRAGRLLAGGRLLRQRLVGQAPRPAATLPEDTLVALFGQAAATQVVAVPCLPRALALARVLGQHGLPARIEIGMRTGSDGLEGHAWVERENRVVGDAESLVGSFVRFTRAAPNAVRP